MCLPTTQHIIIIVLLSLTNNMYNRPFRGGEWKLFYVPAKMLWIAPIWSCDSNPRYKDTYVKILVHAVNVAIVTLEKSQYKL